MNNKQKLFITFGCTLIFLIIAYFLIRMQDNIPLNPEDTVGNSAGNLYNKGLFCEAGDKIYFANAYDNGSLYCMNTDESEITKLHDGNIQYINAGNNYLYYFLANSPEGNQGLGYVRGISGLYRIRTNGSDPTGLSRDAAGCVKLLGNTLYYQHYEKETGVTLHSIETNRKNDTLINNSAIIPAASSGTKLYYAGMEEDHNLYTIDLTTGSSAIELQANLCYPVVEGSYLYYMDLDSDYTLCRVNLMVPSQGAERLTTDRVDTFNVYGNTIFYQRNSESEPALIRMNLDGSNPEIVAEGNYTNINCTGNYTYFTSFGSSVPIYKTSTYGSINVTTFDAAKDAALENME